MKARIILLLLALPLALQAQAPKSFSTEPAVFFKELKTFMELSNKKETEKLLDRFEEMWQEEPKFSAEQQRTIINTCNDMLKKRMKSYPDFSNYVQALIAFINSGREAQLFTNWHSSLDKILSISSRRYSDYIENMAGLFVSNTLYESGSTRWVAGSGDCKFEFDTVPRIAFPVMDLTCYAKGDSSVINGIKGYYYPLSKSFVGAGGKVTWARAGLNPAAVYAELPSLRIDLTGSDWQSDSAVFYNSQFFKQGLHGQVSDKILANAKPETATYPRFMSFDLNLNIKEIIKDADYQGGFAQQGSKMLGAGTRAQKARLVFKRNNKPFLIVSAKSFAVRPERIVSENASIVFYMDKDSISHPSLEFRYISGDREVSMIRSANSGISMPFFNSFHQMDMYVDGIFWKIDDPLMEFRMLIGAGESKMVLESNNLYTDERFRKIQGGRDESPLYTLKQYAEKTGRIIYSADLARYLGTSEQQARSLLLFLANRGFVSYDFEDDFATLNDKLYYYLSARSNKTDYDKIEITSVIEARPNGKLNLMNFELDLQGVSRILLSDSQQVWIAPAEQEMRLLKNRDFEFNGRVHAGRSDFYGKKFKFNYDQFRIDMGLVDSMRLKVESETELDENGKPRLVPLQSAIQNVTGRLYIDSLTNKSSRKSYPPYPVFVSDKESYVYYDQPSVYNGVYKRSSFYFKIDPFTIDSLDNYSVGGLRFPGDFESAGIFPTIREVAVIRPDKSFGFTRESPADGYPMYGGKGKYFNHLDLSGAGLTGSGKIEYLSSQSESGVIRFFPDSTNMDSAAFTLQKATIAGTGFPQANGREVAINWRPGEDRMYVNKSSSNLELYNKTVSLDGNLILAAKGLGGNGNALFMESELYANNFRFGQDMYGADTSEFRLRSTEADLFALQTRNVKSEIDLNRRFGDFIANDKNSFVSFPLNQYICYIAKFRWFIDKQEVDFGEDEKGDQPLQIKGSDFVSLNPMQDSLRWNAGMALYSLSDYLIKARKVKEILVADASILPNDTTTVVVERAAYMRPLNDSRIIANTTTRYHSISEATVQILGRKNYTATGKYSYVDQAKVMHLIALDRIAIDTSLQTYASGIIPDSSNFQLSTSIQYKGKVNIAAANPLLNFEGYARVNHRCAEKLAPNWFSFKSDIDPQGVKIPVNEPRNESLEKLYASLTHSNDSIGFYSTFISPKRRPGDADLITAQGVLSYDPKTKQYKICNLEKAKNPDAPGNLIALNDANCVMYGEGKLDLSTSFGQFKTTLTGNARFNTNNDSTELDVILGLDFLFNEDALKSMVELIETNPTLKATDDTRPTWVKAMKEILGVDRADKMVSEFQLYGAPKRLPQELQQTLILTDVKLFWDKNTLSFKSKGSLGVGFIGNKTVNRLLKGYLEIQRKRGSEVFHLYLESDNATWWYFNYTRGIMQAISSDNKFNDAINSMKPDKRVAEKKGDLPPYEFMLSTDRKKAEFVKKFLGQ